MVARMSGKVNQQGEGEGEAGEVMVGGCERHGAPVHAKQGGPTIAGRRIGGKVQARCGAYPQRFCS
jgi:hypothetical protein